ncbi:MAG: hypothetical protein EOP04_06680 [Proteobacteria bacterium]|nr:MAG: hypothetical protein EOP04_06680 [Pseudomonadota bacterium]
MKGDPMNTSEENSIPVEESMEQLKRVIRGIPIAMMTTVGSDGKLLSRPMVTIDAPDEDALWFFAHDTSQAVRSLVRNPELNLSYVNPNDERYVSVAGHAQRVLDRDKAVELWVSDLKDYFPDGVDDPDLVLLRVEVDTAEFWDQLPNWLARAFRLNPIFPDRTSPVFS